MFIKTDHGYINLAQIVYVNFVDCDDPRFEIVFHSKSRNN